MNDNQLNVCGHQVPIGPMLAHMMLASQELQDELLKLADQKDDISEIAFDVKETKGLLTLKLDIYCDLGHCLPMLTVRYVDNTYTATFEYVGGDAAETLEMSFDEERNILDWLEDNLDTSRTASQEETLPFPDRYDDYLRVKITDIEATPTGTGQWIASGDVWQNHLDAGLQREYEASRKAA